MTQTVSSQINYEPRSDVEGSEAFNEGLAWVVLEQCVSWDITTMRSLTTKSRWQGKYGE